jgi:hypothetical protein
MTEMLITSFSTQIYQCEQSDITFLALPKAGHLSRHRWCDVAQSLSHTRHSGMRMNAVYLIWHR